MTLTQKIPIEIQFAQGLAGNEQKNRDKTLTLLKKFIRLRLPRLKEQLNEDEFIKLWKGMHYQLWMQDKPLIQEKLVDDICQLVHDFPNETYTLMFIKAFFDTEAREWFGLDQWRINKFMMLVREFLHSSFLFLKNCQWKESVCQKLSDIIEESVLNCNNSNLPAGLKMHLIDIFISELGKVVDNELSSDTAVILLSPFLNILPTVKNDNVMRKLLSMLFEASGGKDYPVQNKNSRICGFVERDPSLVKQNKLQFNKELLLKQLIEKGANKKCPAKNRSQIYKLVKRIRYFETHPQKPLKIIKEKDIDETDAKISQKEINIAAKMLKKHKEKLFENVPARKEYKRKLLMEKKKKKSKKTKTDFNDADTEEKEDSIRDGGSDDDSLEHDPEAEFFQMLAESDNEMCEEEMDEDVENLTNDECLLNCEIEDELAKSEVVQESSATTKENKKLQKAGSKHKNEESVEKDATEEPKKKAKKGKGKKKLDNITAAGKMEVDLPEQKKKSKKRKHKVKKMSKETDNGSGISETQPVFGMVDFPEEENDAKESIKLTEVFEVQKSSKDNNKSEEKANNKKVKKIKQTKKNKKAQAKKESQGTNAQSKKSAKLLHFPLPTNAKNSIDISNIQTQNTLQLFEHLKKLKEEKQKSLEKSKKNVKDSPLDRYFEQVKKEVDNIEKNKKSNVPEEKDSSVDKEVPVAKEKAKKQKSKTVSLVVKCKNTPITKDKQATLVKKEPEKPELELEKLYEQPPAFLRNAIAKATKSRKSGKSKKTKAEDSVASKKMPKTPTENIQREKKHVSFNMNQNQAFCAGTDSKHHQTAYHPSKKPENGILKPSPSPIRISKKFTMDKKLSILAKQSYLAHLF